MNRSVSADIGGLNSLSGFAQMVDAAVLVRAQRGDMEAFAALYAHFGRPCYGFALRLTGNATQAEDLVQEVFLKLFDSIRGYRGEAPFGAWLKRMTANAAIDQLRKNKRFADADPEAMFAKSDAPDSNPAQQLDAISLLLHLPPRARAVVVLHELEGYTHTEIAKLFGQSESYSKSILARGLQRLHAVATTASAET